MAPAEAVTTSTSHIAIRIDDEDGDSSSCCAVCMEPSEWVIVGVCGHREVCIYCGAHMRFFLNDRRCCICRAFCATVVVTRGNTNSKPEQVVVDDGGSTQGRRQSVFSEASPGFGGVIRPPGTRCWYHGGVAAFFYDRAPYEAVRSMCSKPLPSPSVSPLPSTGVANNHGAPQDPNRELMSFLLYLAVVALLGATIGLPMATYIEHWLPRVTVAIGFGFLMAACAYFDARRWWFSTSPESDGQRS